MVLTAAICILLVLCSYYDIKMRIIPNGLIVVILALGAANNLLHHTPEAAVSGILLPSLPLLIMRSWMKGIGAGDIKLLSAVGAGLGWLPNVYVLLLACTAALLYAGSQKLYFGRAPKSVPFAPFLAIAALLIYAVIQ
ncbi:prepilin peptidase [Paenibacillus alkalitolerans]|uniref:prepilin peptidase n=1 Tax=Paenibacillus alkalitolerans TaxID=2799335 RepID=UPI001F1B01FF|nr:A24 family peptidase [Paenibacillus alkalitolerans]